MNNLVELHKFVTYYFFLQKPTPKKGLIKCPQNTLKISNYARN